MDYTLFITRASRTKDPIEEIPCATLTDVENHIVSSVRDLNDNAPDLSVVYSVKFHHKQT